MTAAAGAVMDNDSDDDDDDDSADGGQMVPECLAHQKWGKKQLFGTGAIGTDRRQG